MTRKPFVLFLVTACVFQAAAAAVIGLDRPPSRDEGPFLVNIRHFMGGVTLEKLRSYPEIKGPLMFIVYAKVADVVGFEPWKLRTLSVAISIVTYCVYYLLLWHVFRSHKVAWLACGLLMVNPYMIRLSVFIYVDMMPLLFLIGFLALVLRGKVIPAFVVLAGTLLVSQHYVFALAGVGLFYAARALLCREKRVHSALMLIGCGLSMVPFGLLVLLWHGICPPKAALVIPRDESLYHPNYLTAYILLLPVYVAPILLLRLKSVYFSLRRIASACLLSVYYYFFPVRLSRLAEGHTPAIGMFHRLVQLGTRGNRSLEHVVLYLTFALGIPVLLCLIRDCYGKVRGREFDLALLLDLMILSFLLIMPFSFLVWEKYFVPVIPLLSVRLLLIGRTGDDAGSHP